jgi:hypothetical protein
MLVLSARRIFSSVFLVLHIIGGGVGLVSGTLNLVMKKGGKIHNLIGHFFFYGMLSGWFISLDFIFYKVKPLLVYRWVYSRFTW